MEAAWTSETLVSYHKLQDVRTQISTLKHRHRECVKTHTRKFIIVLREATELDPILSQFTSFCIFTTYFSKILCHIILPLVLFPWSFPIVCSSVTRLLLVVCAYTVLFFGSTLNLFDCVSFELAAMSVRDDSFILFLWRCKKEIYIYDKIFMGWAKEGRSWQSQRWFVVGVNQSFSGTRKRVNRFATSYCHDVSAFVITGSIADNNPEICY